MRRSSHTSAAAALVLLALLLAFPPSASAFLLRGKVGRCSKVATGYACGNANTYSLFKSLFAPISKTSCWWSGRGVSNPHVFYDLGLSKLIRGFKVSFTSGYKQQVIVRVGDNFDRLKNPICWNGLIEGGREFKSNIFCKGRYMSYEVSGSECVLCNLEAHEVEVDNVAPACALKDSHLSCKLWAGLGFCATHSLWHSFMRLKCSQSCYNKGWNFCNSGQFSPISSTSAVVEEPPLPLAGDVDQTLPIPTDPIEPTAIPEEPVVVDTPVPVNTPVPVEATSGTTSLSSFNLLKDKVPFCSRTALGYSCNKCTSFFGLFTKLLSYPVDKNSCWWSGKLALNPFVHFDLGRSHSIKGFKLAFASSLSYNVVIRAGNVAGWAYHHKNPICWSGKINGGSYFNNKANCLGRYISYQVIGNEGSLCDFEVYDQEQASSRLLGGLLCKLFDNHLSCPSYAKAGYCATHSKFYSFMRSRCSSSCYNFGKINFCNYGLLSLFRGGDDTTTTTTEAVEEPTEDELGNGIVDFAAYSRLLDDDTDYDDAEEDTTVSRGGNDDKGGDGEGENNKNGQGEGEGKGGKGNKTVPLAAFAGVAAVGGVAVVAAVAVTAYAIRKKRHPTVVAPEVTPVTPYKV